ncbi:hypothetical protein ABW19_dt0202558 [Dactylella cylindrospora]|nr:hypothetical protein ABW19_dt0202558 [Dactylella cylindrospora]
MTDWRVLGYVPDSESEDDGDTLLSPPGTVPDAATQKKEEIRAKGSASNTAGKSELDVYDIPSSSIEIDDEAIISKDLGRSRPLRRGRGAKRLSAGGSNRPKKQAKIGEAKEDNVLHPDPTAGNSENTIYSIILGEDRAISSRIDASEKDIQSAITPSGLGAQTIDLMDEHGPYSDAESNIVEPIVPPSSPPLLSRMVLSQSSTSSPILPNQISTNSFLEVVIPTPTKSLTESTRGLRIQTSSAANSDIPNIPVDDFTAGIARNLRERKPIQLNPYLIEEQRYNKTLKSRGIRPIKYVYNDPILPSNKKHQQDESQEDDWVAQNDDLETQTVVATQSFQSIEPEIVSMGATQEDSLPRLENIFETHRERIPSPETQTMAKGKRKRMTKDLFTLSAKTKDILIRAKASVARGRLQETDPDDSGNSPRTPSGKANGQTDIFDILSSDHDLTPRKTPKSAGRRRPLVIDSDDSDIEIGRNARAASPLPSNSSDSSETDPDVREREIERFQKRVRGVLPASYLRLNNPNTQSEAQKRGEAHRSPGKRPAVPGMAQIRIRNRASPPPGSSGKPLSLSSSESSEDEGILPPTDTPGAPSITPRARPQIDRVSSTVGSRRTYSFEDNTIDRMLARGSGSRRSGGSKNSSKPKKFQQSKLTNGSSHTRGFGQSRDRGSKQRPRAKPAALSVVDACKRYRETKAQSPPLFMRIAERRARRKKNDGRHLPDGKVIKFDGLVDDETETEDTLARWRRAKLGRASSGGVITQRKAAGGSSNNIQPRFDKHHLPLSTAQNLVQAKLPYHSGESDLTAKPRLKPRIRYKAMPTKPLAIIERRGHRRIDDVIKSLWPKLDDPIEDNTPESPTPQSPIPRQHELPIIFRPEPELYQRLPHSHINKPPQQLFVNAQSKVINKEGKHVARPTRRARKHPLPKQINRNRSPPSFQPPEVSLQQPEANEIAPEEAETFSFENMPPLGTHFSRNFDIKPPESRALFHVSTFIGSGCLLQALETRVGSTLLQPSPIEPLCAFETRIDWGVYDESVGSQFEECAARMLQTIETVTTDLGTVQSPQIVLDLRRVLHYVVRYLSRTISFSDSIDISSFASRFTDILVDLIMKTNALELTDGHPEQHQLHGLLKITLLSYALVVLNQIGNIASQDQETLERTHIREKQIEVLNGLIKILINFGTSKLEPTLSKAHQFDHLQGKPNDRVLALEAWVIAYHISSCSQLAQQRSLFWDSINQAISLSALKQSRDIGILEASWRAIFRLLPVTNVDAHGKISPPMNDFPSSNNWNFAREVVTRSLYIYNKSRSKAQYLANSYIKALYSRCLALIEDWKWSNPDAIVTTLYDFFARRGLHNLTNETDRGSPTFLQHLDSRDFEPINGETCFSTLLKCVAVGMDRTKKFSTDKAVGDLLVRLLPNHGRTFLKEEELVLDDLNSLRNHHDLLTAIYYGIGSNRKKRIIGITHGLVDPSKSHSTVCSLSLRTWANIMNFELSDEKSPAILGELMNWHSHIVNKTIEVHKELNGHMEHARKTTVDQQHLNDIKTNFEANRRSLEAILLSGVNLLNNVLKNPGCDFYSAQLLLASDSMKCIFSMSQGLPQKLVAEAVNIVSSHVRLCRNFGYSEVQDESQTWAGFDSVESDETRKEAAEKLQNQIYDPFFDLINGYFATGEQHLDQVLIPCTRVWVELGGLLVDCGLKTWDEYFNAYSRSWFAMIDSDTKKTYSVYYVTSIMKIEPSVYEKHKQRILDTWTASLVERDSMLKFQHELTTAVFNNDIGNILFANMPFEVVQDIDGYDISLRDFKERRLSLISTLLENMQKEALRNTFSQAVKAEYGLILQTLMHAMKQNYIEIQSHEKIADSGSGVVQNSYVAFCQQIVELLQQYTADIIPIDKFFTDSVTFPLPRNDPTYVTSKLKGYALKLGDIRGIIRFYTFFQNTCTRVAVEHQQAYFVDQILAAFEEQREREVMQIDRSGRSLRQFCMCAMFTAYIKRSMDGMSNMILAAPIIVVAARTIRGLTRELDGLEEETDMDEHVARFVVVTMDASRIALESCLRALSEPLGLYVLNLLVQLVVECDKIVNLLHLRVTGASESVSVSHDLLKVVIRELSRLRAFLKSEPLPERLDTLMLNQQLQLPLNDERRKFEVEYTNELKSWNVDASGEIRLGKTGSRRVVGWRHLVPLLTPQEVGSEMDIGRRRLLERLDMVIGEASRGICEEVVREVDELIWDKARRPMVGAMDLLYGIQRDIQDEDTICMEVDDSDADMVFDMDD